MTSPGGRGRHHSSENQMPFITPPTCSAYNGQTQYEYNMSRLQMNGNDHNNDDMDVMMENSVLSANVSILDSDSDSSSENDADENLLNVKRIKKKQKEMNNSNNERKGTPARRPSILGIDYDQLKKLQEKEKKKEKQLDAEEL